MAREMKNSGIEWVKDIPASWTVVRNKNCFDCSKEIVGELSSVTQLLSLTTKGIKEKRPEDTTGKVPETYDTYQVVAPNDIVMCLFDLDVSAVFSGISPYNGMISPAYKVLKCKHNIFPQFADYWFSYIFDGRKFMHYSKNLRYTLNYDEFAILPIILPPFSEQTRIADFLDAECARIDEVIEKTRASIEEYKKLKQSVITEAVTKGIRKNRPMKDSGIEWIGEIPKEWLVKRAKFIANSITKGNGITKEDVSENGDIQCVRYGEIYSKYEGAFKETISATNLAAITAPKFINAGDILFAGTGELIEEIGKNVVYIGSEPCLAGGDIIVMSHSQNPIFFNYALNSQYSQTQKSIGKAKLKVVHISAYDIGNVIIALPPIAEQEEIGEYLDKKCSEINEIIASKETLIREMELYKKSLIYEYVTGKKEVQ